MYFGHPSLAGILHDQQVVFAREVHDRRHVCGQAKNMHGQDGPCPRRDRGFDFSGVELIGGRVDVTENRDCAVHQDGLRRGDKGIGRQNHLVAGSDIKLSQRGDQRLRSVDHGKAALGAHGRGPLLFKRIDRARARPHAAAHDRHQAQLIRLRYPARPARPAGVMCLAAAQPCRHPRNTGNAGTRRCGPLRHRSRSGGFHECPASDGNSSGGLFHDSPPVACWRRGACRAGPGAGRTPRITSRRACRQL